MTEITWPEKPTCHGENPRFARDGVSWRPPRDRDDSPYVETFRTCSYCGSIHPQDLLAAVEKGARLGGSDWKYGWPHKFYVEGIANPVAGTPRRCGGLYLGSGHDETPLEELQKRNPGLVNWRRDRDGGWKADHVAPAPATVHAKWYNDHLFELSPEGFAAIAKIFLDQAGIAFKIEDGRLKYGAPYHGYQA